MIGSLFSMSYLILDQTPFTQIDIRRMYDDAICEYQDAEFQAASFGVPLIKLEREHHHNRLANLICMLLDKTRWRFF
jgi:hypothetical protein